MSQEKKASQPENLLNSLKDILVRSKDSILQDIKTIHERPAEVQERKIPGHWEADLIKGIIQQPYLGNLFLDVSFDKNDPLYIKLEKHLENRDGSPKIPGVQFFYCPLDVAMQNSHYDSPDFFHE